LEKSNIQNKYLTKSIIHGCHVVPKMSIMVDVVIKFGNSNGTLLETTTINQQIEKH